jgi:hypothetical protein
VGEAAALIDQRGFGYNYSAGNGGALFDALMAANADAGFDKRREAALAFADSDARGIAEDMVRFVEDVAADRLRRGGE